MAPLKILITLLARMAERQVYLSISNHRDYPACISRHGQKADKNVFDNTERTLILHSDLFKPGRIHNFPPRALDDVPGTAKKLLQDLKDEIEEAYFVTIVAHEYGHILSQDADNSKYVNRNWAYEVVEERRAWDNAYNFLKKEGADFIGGLPKIRSECLKGYEDNARDFPDWAVILGPPAKMHDK